MDTLIENYKANRKDLSRVKEHHIRGKEEKNIQLRLKSSKIFQSLFPSKTIESTK